MTAVFLLQLARSLSHLKTRAFMQFLPKGSGITRPNISQRFRLKNSAFDVSEKHKNGRFADLEALS